MEEDVAYQGAIEDLNLTASITEDHTYERAQTQIDKTLVPVELVHTLREAHTATTRDHKMVLARLAWGAKGGRGRRGPHEGVRINSGGTLARI
eukprot:6193670-Pleurochrysis_carterae.AAC.1